VESIGKKPPEMHRQGSISWTVQEDGRYATSQHCSASSLRTTLPRVPPPPMRKVSRAKSGGADKTGIGGQKLCATRKDAWTLCSPFRQLTFSGPLD